MTTLARAALTLALAALMLLVLWWLARDEDRG